MALSMIDAIRGSADFEETKISINSFVADSSFAHDLSRVTSDPLDANEVNCSVTSMNCAEIGKILAMVPISCRARIYNYSATAYHDEIDAHRRGLNSKRF